MHLSARKIQMWFAKIQKMGFAKKLNAADLAGSKDSVPAVRHPVCLSSVGQSDTASLLSKINP